MTTRLSELEKEAKKLRRTYGFKHHLNQKLKEWKEDLALVCEEPGAAKKDWSLYLSRETDGNVDKLSRRWPFSNPKTETPWKVKCWKKTNKSMTYVCSADNAAQLYPRGTIAKQFALFGLTFVILPTKLGTPPPKGAMSRNYQPYVYGCQNQWMPRLGWRSCNDQLPIIEGVGTPNLDDEAYISALEKKMLSQKPQQTINEARSVILVKLDTARQNYEKEKARLRQKLKDFDHAVSQRADAYEIQLSDATAACAN